ncbi:MAG: AAA family ATPase [Polyangiaceae bacterium]
MLDAALEDGAASCALVTAPAGVGKSRLRAELELRSRDRSRILSVSGDLVHAKVPLGVVRNLLRTAAGTSLDPAEIRSLPEPHMGPVLAMLAGRIARADLPEVLAGDLERLQNTSRRAFIAWLDACTTEGESLLVVVDDAHWADGASLRWLLDALKELRERGWVLALFGRPEVLRGLPDLSHATGITRIDLPPLPRRAALGLVGEILGKGADAALCDALVERAEGNAFYLEELVRVASHRGASNAPLGRASERSLADLPRSVLAMAQSRLESLDSEERRVLRLASVFGEPIDADALASAAGHDVRETLSALVTREVLAERGVAHHELAFRHALLRDAAYESLTDADRCRAHASAARWLASTADPDPITVADHFALAGLQAEAVAPLVRALWRFFESGDFAAIVRESQRAEDFGAEGRELGEALALAAYARLAEGNMAAATALAERALPFLEPLSIAWFLTAGVLVFASAMGHASESVPLLVAVVWEADPSLIKPSLTTGFVLALFAAGMLGLNQREAADAIFEKMLAIARAEPDHDAFGAQADAVLHALGMTIGHPAEALRLAARSTTTLERIGAREHLRVALAMQALNHVGLFDGAGVRRAWELQRALPSRRDADLWDLFTACYLASSDYREGNLDEAEQRARRVLESGVPAGAALGAMVRAQVSLARGELAAAHAILEPFVARIYDLNSATAAHVVHTWVRILLAERELERAADYASAMRDELRGGFMYPDARVELDVAWMDALERAGRPIPPDELAAARAFAQAIEADLEPSWPAVARAWRSAEPVRALLSRAPHEIG